MKLPYKNGFTLVELMVAMVVGSIAIASAYASYDVIAKQYEKVKGVTAMQSSSRSIMRMIERDIRMAGFKWRNSKGTITFGSISEPIKITDSGNKCCDAVTVIYDYRDEASKKVERHKIHYAVKPYQGRNRLYRKRDILFPKVRAGNNDVLADYVEDLQFDNANATSSGSSDYIKIDKDGAELSDSVKKWSCVKDKKTGLIWEVKTTDGGLRDRKNKYNWYDPNPATNKGYPGTSAKPNTYSYSKNINSLKLCGNHNWRLPTVKELCGIRDNNRGKSPYINTNYFPNSVTQSTWKTSTTYDNPYIVRKWENNSTNTVRFSKNPSTYTARYPCTIWSSAQKTNPASCCVRLVTAGIAQQGQLYSINLILRTKNQYGKDRQFKKKDYYEGNYKINKNDAYKRQEYSSTVLIRNPL